jgi:hypothetical protein
MKATSHNSGRSEFFFASSDTHRRLSGALVLAALVAVACKSSDIERAPSSISSIPAAEIKAAVTPPEPSPAPPSGPWENLLPSATLEGFRRVPIDPLASKAVWQVRPDGALFIDGVGAKEMLLSEREFGDGRLEVEWRFLPAQPATPDVAPTYNGGVYVRTPLDGKSWVQLQVAHAEKPPVVGDLIAQLPGKSERIDVFQTSTGAAPPVGGWVRYAIDMRGPRIELRVDGRQTVVWADCPMPTGHVGLQAEGAAIEVRTLRFQPL